MEHTVARLHSQLAYRLITAGGVLGVLCAGMTGCSQPNHKNINGAAPVARGGYSVQFTATRLKDHSVLTTAVLSVTSLGKTVVLQTPRSVPTEETPALTAFEATLKPTGSRGNFQLITKVSIREAFRNKKGKLKTSSRNQGSLLPIRRGKTESASATGDPIQVEVRLE